MQNKMADLTIGLTNTFRSFLTLKATNIEWGWGEFGSYIKLWQKHPEVRKKLFFSYHLCLSDICPIGRILKNINKNEQYQEVKKFCFLKNGFSGTQNTSPSFNYAFLWHLCKFLWHCRTAKNAYCGLEYLRTELESIRILKFF